MAKHAKAAALYAIMVLFAVIELHAQNCQPQPSVFVCEGKVFGELTTRSCVNSENERANAYNFFNFAGRYVTFTMETTTFAPFVAVFDGGYVIVDWDKNPGQRRSAVTVRLPYTGEYRVFAAATTPNTFGTYSLSASCSDNPPCEPPAVLALTETTYSVRRGSTVTLSAFVTGSPIRIYRWYNGRKGDRSKPLPFANDVLLTPPIQKEEWFWFEVSNSCGMAESNEFHVLLLPEPRRRVAGPRR